MRVVFIRKRLEKEEILIGGVHLPPKKEFLTRMGEVEEKQCQCLCLYHSCFHHVHLHLVFYDHYYYLFFKIIREREENHHNSQPNIRCLCWNGTHFVGLEN